MLLTAEVLLEECLLENMELLRSSIPLMDRTQPRLLKVKGHLNAILSRGRLTVSPIRVFSLCPSGSENTDIQINVFSVRFVNPVFLQPRYLNEALLLTAKVHYVQGRYRDAQGMCARVGLEELTQEDQPTYHLRLLAEAFVIKGQR